MATLLEILKEKPPAVYILPVQQRLSGFKVERSSGEILIIYCDADVDLKWMSQLHRTFLDSILQLSYNKQIIKCKHEMMARVAGIGELFKKIRTNYLFLRFILVNNQLFILQFNR